MYVGACHFQLVSEVDFLKYFLMIILTIILVFLALPIEFRKIITRDFDKFFNVVDKIT